ncbi:MAG: MmcQ/YjbR family DNA-binding protein [Planctomycetes bacterium]|nr:MmcQ/YjbR family DNA-binding protein [Planctomycetota bacterium]
MSHAEETGPPSAADAERARTLHDYALDFPETALEHPWGHDAYKVNGKIFLFLDCDANGLRLTVKLPDSGFEALLLPFTKPTGYGMGKHGWVTASFVAGAKPPMGLLHAWVLESYRAIAPKRALKVLDGAPTSAPKPTTRKRTTKKAAATRAQAATKTTKTKRTPR